MKILMTGANGFVGKNIQSLLSNQYNFESYNFKEPNIINHDVIIHLAGIAHDFDSKYSLNDYISVNTDLTIDIYNKFLKSNASTFIFLSSIKSVCDSSNNIITENSICNPKSFYGQSKYLAEKYILDNLDNTKRVIILRPTMLHGPNNRGNLNLLYNYINKNLPWVLCKYDNNRSFCYIENLTFVINEIILNKYFKSGVYNVSDNDPISTNNLVKLIADSLNKKIIFYYVPKLFIKYLAIIGDFLKLPFNTNRLKKLTENYIVSNSKLIKELKKDLPFTSKAGFVKTFQFFNTNI
jgi:nucleoside-diphosphate-sugar epimerase